MTPPPWACTGLPEVSLNCVPLVTVWGAAWAGLAVAREPSSARARASRAAYARLISRTPLGRVGGGCRRVRHGDAEVRGAVAPPAQLLDPGVAVGVVQRVADDLLVLAGGGEHGGRGAR